MLKNSFKAHRDIILYSFWLPLIWTAFLLIEILFFAGVKRESLSLFGRVFEDLVFVMSFLFYNSKALVHSVGVSYAPLLVAFFVQFFFWWLVSFFVLMLKKFLTR
jgi:hypothetical protein